MGSKIKLLVTGGAGFIGSNTIKKLLDLDYFVVCVDNFNDYYNPKIKEKNIEKFLTNKNFKLYKEDICNFPKMEEIFKKEGFDKICHLAARVGVRPSIKNPFLYEEVNVRGTLNMLELSKIYKIKNFVFASSSSVYGNNKKIPFSESDNVDFPISPYAATKKTCELLAYTYHHLYNLKCTGLRFFTVYGPSGRPDMAPFLFVDAIYKGKEIKKFGDGTAKRDYTYIDDITSGIISAIEKDLDYEIINLGNNKPVELNYFISLIEKLLNEKAIIKNYPKQLGDVDITYADISKAQRLLNYDPKISIEEGMKKFVRWYLNS
ncbi:MAG: GDP-mannose 4,6-dehydratase [Patescibacteria group bacterium]